MTNRLHAPLAILGWLLLSAGAEADILTVTQTGSGSGDLNGVAFPTSSFTITSILDTGHRVSFAGESHINATSASIAISGLGSFNFTTPTLIFVSNTLPGPGISRVIGGTGGDLFDGPTDPAFSTWDMLTAIGPISGDGELQQWDITPVNTSGGVLRFDNGHAGATFTATIVPEPSSVVLLTLGGLTLRRRRLWTSVLRPWR
jgi:hypothetical protein